MFFENLRNFFEEKTPLNQRIFLNKKAIFSSKNRKIFFSEKLKFTINHKADNRSTIPNIKKAKPIK